MSTLPFLMARTDDRAHNWCWAATAVSARAFYFHDPPQQCQVAAQLLAMPACDDPSAADQSFFLERALHVVDCFGGMFSNPFSPEEAVAEILAQRPVGCRIEWTVDGGGHFVVLSGITNDGASVHVKDPRGSEADLAFDDFAAAYCGQGQWTHTYRMTHGNTAPPPVTDGPPGGRRPRAARVLRAASRAAEPGEYPIYTLSVDMVAAGDIAAATCIGFRRFSNEGPLVEAVDAFETAGGPMRHRGPRMREAHEAVRARSSAANGWLRFLEIPSLGVSALWDVRGGGDIVIALPPLVDDLSAAEQTAAEFLATLAPAAAARQNQIAAEHHYYYTPR